ncbi:tight junction protein ZO-1 [Harmonia axyridis]|uniref:tight junction protein ZO-1 n=1 Tax=Harmonia axyridis TaxID=115357 RepID=UPI001E275ACD|nr:tight junction protein ZO-1 [Harmonia axyridis]
MANSMEQTRGFLVALVILAVLSPIFCISITIHSEPKQASTVGTSAEITTVVTPTENASKDVTLSTPERHKRLLPYLNYYVAQNKTYTRPSSGKPRRYHVYVQNNPLSDSQTNYFPEDKNLYTPFLETNALPGPFVPMVSRNPPKNIKIHYITLQTKPQTQKPTIDFSSIYGKLYALKTKEQHRQPIQVENYENPIKYKARPQQHPTSYKYHNSKTVVQTYTPTQIDINPSSDKYSNNYSPEISISTYRNELKHIQQPYGNKQVALELPQNLYTSRPKQKQNSYRKPVIILQKPPVYYDDEGGKRPETNPVIYVQARPQQNYRPYSAPVVQENYVAQKYLNYPKYEEVPSRPQTYQPDYYQYEPEYPIQPITPSPVPTSTEPIHIEQNLLSHEDPRSLGILLKKLQDANALPQTLTVDNIDNSIKTLVKILDSLKKHRTSFKPIVVADENEEYSSVENDSSKEISSEHPNVIEPIEPVPVDPVSISHSYTEEGGTPGTPGVDYPALSSIPPTSFNCKTQRYKGFFGDPDTNCQVWHYCDLNGGQASFLCPNGTIFSQVALTCDWWYNVKCSSTPQLYVLNERLYKYILPFAPKFPEDYTGPLVDKYLAIKFMEMEEKMKKERKGKDKSEEDSSSEEATEESTEANTEKPI